MPKTIQKTEPPIAKQEMRSAKSFTMPSLMRAARNSETAAIITAGIGPNSVRVQRRFPPANNLVEATKGRASGESDITAAVRVRTRTKLA